MFDPQQAQPPPQSQQSKQQQSHVEVKNQQKSPFIEPSKPLSSHSPSTPPLPINSSNSAPIEALRSSMENLKKVFKETMDLYKEVENASRCVVDLNESSILNDSLSCAMNDLSDIKNEMKNILPDIDLDNPQTNQLLEKYSQLLINAVLSKK